MRILIDTNILIPLETPNRILDYEYSRFVRLAAEYNCTIFIHKANLDDIKRYKNKKDLKVILSRFNKYPILKYSKEPDSSFLKIINSEYNTPKVKSDDRLLYALYKNCVNILVTNDNGIYEKSKLVNINSRIYRLEQAISFLEEVFKRKTVELPNIQDDFVYNIDKNDEIFNSVKADYGDFDTWFDRVSASGRKTWVVKNLDGNIEAICIYKEENQINGIKGKILKLCTFIVKEDFRGKKLGELLLKEIFRYSFLNTFELAYIEFYPLNKDFLISLIEDFGFIKFKEKANKECIYIKYFCIEDKIVAGKLGPLDFVIKYFPYFLNSDKINKFIIPIKSKYHYKLFPDDQSQPSLFYPNESVSNSIKKAYICNSKIKKIYPGDIAIFYRSGDIKSLTNIGIIEEILRTNNANELAAFVGKRTVYSFKEMAEKCKKEAIGILFRHVKNLNIKINFNSLKGKGIIKGPVQSIIKVSNKNFLKVFKESGGNIEYNFFTDKTQLCF